jgi:uncharacterized membrane protein YphA (DoxX/SURF4 family)
VKTQPWFPWVSLVARLVLGAVMLVAGALKVTDPVSATQAVRAYELLPSALDSPVGLILPFLEIAIGLLLIVGFGVRPAALAAGVFMVVFIAAVSSAWARGLAIDCGCFGGGGDLQATQNTTYASEIARDTGLLIVAGLLAWRPAGRFSVDNWIAGPAGPGARGEEAA